LGEDDTSRDESKHSGLDIDLRGEDALSFPMLDRPYLPVEMEPNEDRITFGQFLAIVQ
jgi:hypothetical protein